MIPVRLWFAAAIFCTACAGGCGAPAESVSLADFIEENRIGNDATLAFRRAVEYCRQHRVRELVVPAGTYDVYPDLAFEKYEYVTNNSAGLKRLLFDLDGIEDFTLRGEGAYLVLHGYVSAFSVVHCTNVTIRGFTVDYARTFHSEGTITGVGENYLDLRFSGAYPYRIVNGDLHFYDEAGAEYPVSHLLEFDVVRREPAFHARDYWLRNKTVPAEQLPNGDVRIFHPGLTGKAGNILVLGPAHRMCPGVAIDRSRSILIEDLTLHHCGGMGVVAQMSSDIELDGVRIVTAPESDRVISITADATHFTHCDGYVRMIGCEFFNQIDDATNIHGMYGIVKQVTGPSRLRVFFPHEQQYGLDVLESGVEAEILAQRSLITHTTGRITSMERLNKEWYEVTFDGDLSQLAVGDLITRTCYPEVLIRNCRMGNNRARGLLLGSRKKTVVEDCYFHTPGAAILFEGDGYYWYEQAGVRDVEIRHCVFDDCLYGAATWGDAVIATGNGPKHDREQSRYHRNIRVEGNTFRGFDPRIVNLYCVDGFVFTRDNAIEYTDDYSDLSGKKRNFIIRNCDNIVIEKEQIDK